MKMSLDVKIVNRHTKRKAKILDLDIIPNWCGSENPMVVYSVEYLDDGLQFYMNEFYEAHWDLVDED
tara:strand:+ start:1437 stop:1637 length:201 start_codon:yes stop_codon:yes gene_type:complete